jgi:BlaI family penicillinase repressor
MKEISRISEAEWEVMEVFWRRSPQTAAEVCATLRPDTRWKSTTVRTLIARLVAKGILRHEADGKRYLYSAARSREECVEAASDSFLERIFGGSVRPLLLHFAGRTRLSKSDAEKLRQILGGTKS